VFEILLPCLFFVILASVRHLLSATQKPESTCVFLLDLLHGLTRFEIASYCSDYTSPIDYPRPYFTAANPEQVHILFFPVWLRLLSTSGAQGSTERFCSDYSVYVSISNSNASGYNAIAFAPNTPESKLFNQ
jgi:hypothetical protein